MDEFETWKTRQLEKQRENLLRKKGRKKRKTPRIPHGVQSEARAFFAAHSLLLATPSIAKPNSKKFRKIRWYLSQYLSMPGGEKEHWRNMTRGEMKTERATNLLLRLAQKIHLELF